MPDQNLNLFSAAKIICVSVSMTMLPVEKAEARSHHHSHRHHVAASDPKTCAKHTAFGEGRGKGKVEAAIIVNGLKESAKNSGRSICAEAYARYKPKAGSTLDIDAAVENVFSNGASLVPSGFKNATEFRAPGYHLKSHNFVRLGQVTPHGNVFYVPRRYARANP